jgi:hypothetical protein
MESVPGGKVGFGIAGCFWLYAGVVCRYITCLYSSHPPKVMVTAATEPAHPLVGRTRASTFAAAVVTWMRDGAVRLHGFAAG